MKKLLILACAASITIGFVQERALAQDATSVKSSSSLAMPRTQVIPIQDPVLDRPYELYIKLPEGYSDNDSLRYPVIYYTDALWHVEILSGSAEYIMEEAILVGISWQLGLTLDVGPHVSRFRDYSIRASKNPEHQAKYRFGQAGNHLSFIRKEVIAYVENNYRADPDRRTYFGYSLGGKFGVYILLNQPDTFHNYILGSPSLKGEIPYFTEASQALKEEVNASVFLSHGSQETELSEYFEQLVTLLKNRNDESLFLHQAVLDGTHQTAFPMTAVSGVTWLSQLDK